MDETEVENVRNMKLGDEEAFSWLFRRYQTKAFRAAWLITGNFDDSEDIVQETFIKCYTSRKKLKEERAFEGWLFQILTRTAWHHMKKKGRERPEEQLFGEDLRDCRSNPLDKTVEKEGREKLYQAIRNLDMKQRTAVVLYYFNSFSTKEIADAMGCLEGTVKSRLYTARKNLKTALEKQESIEQRQEGRYEERTI